MHRIAIVILALACVGAVAGTAFAEKSAGPTPASDTPGRAVGSIVPAGREQSRPALAPAASTTVIGSWTFDDGMGGADPQGWTALDMTAQVDTFFHVDDFAGLGGGSFGRLAPISGARSLWCGARPSADPYLCVFASLPGYGNRWNQTFVSRTFDVTGHALVDYHIRTDIESGTDFAYFEYLSAGGEWRVASEFTGIIDEIVEDTIPSWEHGGSLKVRFRFCSDISYSDEDGNQNTDGAVIVDDIVVWGDGVDPVDVEDFEDEAPGARLTADGDWKAGVLMPFGAYAGLFDGSAVLQEDPLVTNTTHFWGFFDGSSADYSCGGHPEQTAVPYGVALPDRSEDADPAYLDNRLISPAVPMPAGIGIDTTLVLQFDVYRDLSYNASIYYAFYVRSRSGDCWGPWRNDYMVRYGNQKDWYRATFDIRKYVDAGAEMLQVAIGAIDLCGQYGTCTCHSHAPLIDNVQLLKIAGPDEFVVTNTSASGPGSLRQAILDANAMSSKSIVTFNIPGTGPHYIDCTTTAAGTASAPIVIDGTTQPGYAGSPVVTVYRGVIGLTGGDSEIRGLKLQSISTSDNLFISSSRSHVHGMVIQGGRYGIYISGDDNVVGGVGTGEANEITLNSTGVLVSSGTGNTIRGNSIRSNTNLGIDLSPLGVTPNDEGDADTGANDKLNFPIVEYVVTGSPGYVGGYVTGSAAEIQTVDFYATPSCDASGYGEGATYLGSTSVGVIPGVVSRFHAALPSIPAGQAITATATDRHGCTSEFSQCFTGSSSVFVVTNTSDSGDGSLRWAIQSANASSDRSIILFAIPGTYPHTINVGVMLPDIQYSTVIDGYSQPGSSPNTNPVGEPDNAVITIRIDCTESIGLRLSGGQSLVRGIRMNGIDDPIRILASASAGNRIEGCDISSGVFGIETNAEGTIIGGSAPACRNRIGGCFDEAISVAAGGHVRILGNYIGVALDGTTPTGNGFGVRVSAASTGGCAIGGAFSEEGNIIANSSHPGVAVYSPSTGNSIIGNSIYNSTELGIDLMPGGVTPNDPSDNDTGANLLQNFPDLWEVVSSPQAITIMGTLQSTPYAAFRVHCYANPACDANGYGEGKVYLGETSFTMNHWGLDTFTFDVPPIVPAGWFVTATATDAAGNTSELSACLEIINTPAGSGVVAAPVDESTGEAPATLTFAEVTVPGITTLQTSTSGPELPGAFVAGNATYYELATTATFSGTIEVCIAYDEVELEVQEADLRLLHWDETLVPAQWVDVTTSLDVANNTVCGETDHLSPFVIGAGSLTGIDLPKPPTSFALRQNVPNPFNPVTTISYDVPGKGAAVNLAIYDVSGRRVRTLVSGPVSAGTHAVRWDGRNDRGDRVATGVYFCRMRAGAFIETRKMVLLR